MSDQAATLGGDGPLPVGVRQRPFPDHEEPQLATRGEPVYGEATVDGWRAWDPHRSKLAATVAAGLDTGIAADDTVLYLGAANGTTVSHVADVAGRTYAVEFAARPVRDLLDACESRPRLFPLVKDAREPATYAHVVEADVDAIVQDVATRGQATVAVRNAQFLADDGQLVLAVKARSEDVTAEPETVFAAVRETLAEAYEIRAEARLEPFHDAHLAIVATPK